jgi:hypothetical protein
LSEDVDRGRWLARSAGIPSRTWDVESPRLSVGVASNDEILAWLAEESARLDALGVELAPARAETEEKHAFVPVQTRAVAVGARAGAAVQVADLGSARR